MASDAQVHSEKSAASETSGGQEGVREAVTATSPAADAASAEGSGSGNDTGAQTGGDPLPASTQAGCEEQTGHAAGALIAIPSSGVVAGDTLTDALAALDRRDYATAKRLFAVLGRTDAAQAIDSALAALDRKDFATAQSLFEALAPAKSAAQRPDPTASNPPREIETRSTPLELVPSVEPEFRDDAPRSERAKGRRRTPRLLVAGLALLAIVGGAAIYASRLGGDHATAGFASAVDLVKAPLVAITGSSEREQDRSAIRDLNAALTQVTARLDRIEREYGDRLDKLGQGADSTTASRFAEMTARLEKLEKKVAAPGAPFAESTDVSARIDKLEKKLGAPSTPASEFAEIRTRLDKLEKKVVAQTASPTKIAPPAKAVAPATTNSAALVARAEPSAPNDAIAPVAPKPLLRNYSVEDVQDGVAMVDSRYGPIQVAPGDLIPGAGRVLRIERHGPDWFVVTSLGVITSGPAR